MTGIIRVNPNDLINAAAGFGTRGSTVSALTSEMTTLVTGLSADWEGEAATTYITKFKGLEDDIQLMNRMIQEHVTDLQEMAAKYTDVESENVQAASTLSSDVII